MKKILPNKEKAQEHYNSLEHLGVRAIYHHGKIEEQEEKEEPWMK